MPSLVTSRVVDGDEVAGYLAVRHDVLEERQVGEGEFTLAHGPFRSYRRTVEFVAGPPDAPAGAVEVVERIDYELAVPVWGLLFAVPVRRTLLRRPRAGRRWWMPPDHLEARAADTLSRLCAFSMIAGYLGTLLTQTNTFFREDFGATEGQVGTMLAFVRIGALLALGLIAVADRRGRRRVLLWSTVVGCLLTATGALAPDLAVLGFSQTLSRAFSTALVLVISIIAVEEMPARSRAFAVSVLTATAALGAGAAVGMVTVAGLAPWAWRLLYVVPLLVLPGAVVLGRGVPETRRFDRAAAAAGAEPGRPNQQPDQEPGHQPARAPGRARRWRWRWPEGVDRGRLALLSASSMAFALFVIPASSFLNDYLRTERGFSAGMITVFQLATNTPGGIGIVVGGRLADQRGRRKVGAIGVGSGVALTVAMYLLAGWPIWVCSMMGSVLGAMAVPALGVYGPELFPTRARGAANGVINLAAVAGSALGLVVAGQLAERLGSWGPAMAVLSVGGLVVVVLVLTLYPETAARELEELNPADSTLSREAFGFEGLDADIVPELHDESNDRAGAAPAPPEDPPGPPPANPPGKPTRGPATGPPTTGGE